MEKYICVNRVAFTIKGFQVYWYGLIICLAIVAALLTAICFCKIRKIEFDAPVNIALVALPCGILCGRLFSVIFEPELSMSDYFNFRTGGMSIIGAVIGGAIAILVYTLIKKEKNFFKYFDIICAVLLLAQGIGRWGNYFNSELYGQLIENPAIKGLPFAVEVDGQYYQALFLFESILDLIGFFFTAEIFLGIKKTFGYTTAFYLIYYGTVRSILENMRDDAFILKWGSIKVSLLFSVLMICAGIAVYITIFILKKRAKSASKRA